VQDALVLGSWLFWLQSGTPGKTQLQAGNGNGWLWILAWIAGGVAFLTIIAFVLFFAWVWKKQSAFRDAIAKVTEALQFAWCFLLIYFWLLRFYLRRVTFLIVLVVFICSGVWTALELSSRLLSTTMHWVRIGWLREIGDSVVGWEGFRHPAVLAALLVIEVGIVANHRREIGQLGREKGTLLQMGRLLGPLKLANLPTNPLIRAQRRSAFLAFFSQAMADLFHTKGIFGMHVSIMEPDAADMNKLKIVFASNPSQIDMSYYLDAGCGGAGMALQCRSLFYFPNVGYKHGIQIIDMGNGNQKLEVLPNVYKPGGGKDGRDFRSIICVPLTDSLGVGRGVLNLSAWKPDAYSHSDFDRALLAGKVLEFLY
jgi:hypothetical protein